MRGEISISAGFAPNLLLGSKFNPRTSTLNPEACTLNVRGGAPFPMNAPQPVSGVGNYARNSLGRGAYWQITKIGDTVPTPKLPSLCRGQRWNQEGNVQQIYVESAVERTWIRPNPAFGVRGPRACNLLPFARALSQKQPRKERVLVIAKACRQTTDYTGFARPDAPPCPLHLPYQNIPVTLTEVPRL